jgi:hypothetical protein
MFIRKPVQRIKGFAFLMWHARHEWYHVMFGLLWAWILREWWGEFNPKWVLLSAFGSVLPDIDHFIYFLGYGRKESYTQTIWSYIQNRQWRLLVTFIETGHKYNTNLSFHNYFVMMILFAGSCIAYFFDWKASVVLFGAMTIHYIYDVIDDIITLGHINPNWKRWGRKK